VVPLIADMTSSYLFLLLQPIARLSANQVGVLLLIAKVRTNPTTPHGALALRASCIALSLYARMYVKLTSSSLSPSLWFFRQLFDAVTVPVIGTASDATRTRWGRRRPWMAAALPFVLVFNMLVWTHWPALDGQPQATFAYYVLCLCALTLGMSCFYIPYTALPVTVSAQDGDRVRLVTARTFFSFLGTMAGSLLYTLLPPQFPGAARSKSFLIAAGITSGLLAVAMVLAVVGVHEPSSAKVQLPLRA
jgi:Na+/melibiose symporter-like transporter